jgi:polynucleotide 5'-hydroxyl-kinase GRC3/NOL9
MWDIRKPLTRDFFGEGIYFFLGAADVGKTTLISRIGAGLAAKRSTAIVDADTGQSHIGPPATVGWAIARPEENDLENLPLGEMAFVGEISPVGHLLQETGAIAQCVKQAAGKANTVLIDTPGFISGFAACALWWEVVRSVQPEAIIAVNRGSELNEVLRGVTNCGPAIEIIGCCDAVKNKSPEQRRAFRQRRFARYFADVDTFEIRLKDVGVQNSKKLNGECAQGRLVGLRNDKGTDLAMGFVVDWQDGDKVIVKAPLVDPKEVRCIAVGDATIDLPG